MAVALTYTFDPGGTMLAMSAVADGAADLTPFMDQVGALLEQSARDRIEDSNVGPDGVPWAPSGRVEEEGGKTLFDSGRLAASLTHVPYPDRVDVGSGLIYAGVQQGGATITPKSGDALAFRLPSGEFVTVGSVTIPARPYLGVSDQDAEDIEELAGAFFRDLLEAAP